MAKSDKEYIKELEHKLKMLDPEEGIVLILASAYRQAQDIDSVTRSIRINKLHITNEDDKTLERLSDFADRMSKLVDIFIKCKKELPKAKYEETTKQYGNLADKMLDFVDNEKE